jgi:VanZ family protein
MKKFFSIVPRWFPALFIMLVIYVFSSQPGERLPNFLDWDDIVKKTSHVVIYGLLALSYLRLFKDDNKYYWLAWIMTLLYAATDEFHQSFVPHRTAAVFDILVFDNLGAAIALWLHFKYLRK